MPRKALIKAVDTFVNHNSFVDGAIAPFLFVGCETGGHAFIRHSAARHKMPQYLKNCYIEFLWNREYFPTDDDGLTQLIVLINYMFRFDTSLIQVRKNIKSQNDFEYVMKHTESAFQKIQDFLFDEMKRQYQIASQGFDQSSGRYFCKS